MKRLCGRTGAARTAATTWLGVPVGRNARDDDEADKAEQDPERDAQPMRPFLLPMNPKAIPGPPRCREALTGFGPSPSGTAGLFMIVSSSHGILGG